MRLRARLRPRWRIRGLFSSLDPGTLYKWRGRFESKNPLFPRSPWVHLSGNAASEADLRTAGSPTSAPDFASDPASGLGLGLGPSSPNPFRGTVSFTWWLPRDAGATLTVHDVQGRLVRTLVSGERPAGTWRESWDGHDEHGAPVAAGVYWFRLLADGEQVTSRIVHVE